MRTRPAALRIQDRLNFVRAAGYRHCSGPAVGGSADSWERHSMRTAPKRWNQGPGSPLRGLSLDPAKPPDLYLRGIRQQKVQSPAKAWRMVYIQQNGSCRPFTQPGCYGGRRCKDALNWPPLKLDDGMNRRSCFHGNRRPYTTKRAPREPALPGCLLWVHSRFLVRSDCLSLCIPDSVEERVCFRRYGNVALKNAAIRNVMPVNRLGGVVVASN